MKRIALIAVLILSLAGMTACGKAGTERGSDKLTIVATIFPIYDWTLNILGDMAGEAEVTLLLNSGVDMHSYQPSVGDIMKLSTCDVFIYVGGESDEWVEDALAEAINKNMTVINLMDILGDKAKTEEVVEGMQSGHDHDEDGEDEEEYDEHIWLSLKNAAFLCDAIADKLAEADPDNAKKYAENADAYINKLSELDRKYMEKTGEAALKTLLFGDRFPFRYLTDDYGLSYYAAFAGCEAETEASFETIIFLADKIDTLGLSTILVIDGSDGRIAGTIRENTKTGDQQILTLDSMQSVTSENIENGTTYIGIMEENLNILIKALRYRVIPDSAG